MLKLTGILETVLYTDNLQRAAEFYESVLGLAPLFSDARMIAFDVARRGVLLIFVRGETTEPVETPFGTIPPHDGSGPLHVAFSVTASDLDAWRERLLANGIEIESTVNWPRGGHSLYFRDPDGHCLELATPGLWPGY
jgi:catechol 2,3-dioxygenase-like lactoylglutathione lyase family enzyme